MGFEFKKSTRIWVIFEVKRYHHFRDVFGYIYTDFLAIDGRQLNGSGVLKGLGIHWPKSQGGPDMAVTGQLVAKLRATEISWDVVTVPVGAPADATVLQARWVDNGLVLVQITRLRGKVNSMGLKIAITSSKN